LKTVLISSAMSGLTLGVYQDEGMTLPVVGYSTTATTLSSKTKRPYFLRTCMPDSYQAVILALLMKWFG
jgi:ABC-type branched-subunit amino acid transport system substrate-binding protein